MKLIKNYITNFFLNIFQFLFKKKRDKIKISLNRNYKILLLLKGSVSDSLMATPLIKILKDNSGAQISILTNRSNNKVFGNNKGINSVFNFSENIPEQIKLLYELRANKFDVLINLNEYLDYQTTLILGLIKVKYKIGFFNVTPNLLTHPIDVPSKISNHKVDRLLKLTEAFDFIYSKKGLNIIYQSNLISDISVKSFLNEKNIKDKLLVCINISTYNENIPSWKTDSYVSLIKYLNGFKVNIIVTSSVYDIKTAEKVAINNCNTFFNTDFDEYASLIKHSDFIFTPDSFTVHLAAAFEKPVFVLFNDGDELLQVPYNSDFDFVLNEKEDLSKLTYGKVLNSFVPYFDYVFDRYGNKQAL